MSFSSLISQIKHKTKDSEAKPSYSYDPNAQKPKAQTPSSTGRRPLSKSSYEPQYTKTVDPAVQRLKELRRIENAKKEAQNPKPKTQRQRTSSSTTRAAPVRRRKTPEVSIKETVLQERPRSSSPQKRLTFAELMNQAQEKSKTLKDGKKDGKKDESVQPATQPTKYVSKTQPKTIQPRSQRSSSAPSSQTASVRKPTSSLSNSRPSSRPPQERIPSRPKELAKPSAKLQAKLDARKKNQRAGQPRSRSRFEDDEYESDFIEDDDEEDQYEEEAGYDRDEIWKMFNRGKTRADYYDDDDDLSDMEATGSEVMNEEMRSAKRARLEEKAEAERERRRLEEKRRRLGKK